MRDKEMDDTIKYKSLFVKMPETLYKSLKKTYKATAYRSMREYMIDEIKRMTGEERL
jgi:hypothetical protein